MPDQRTPEEKRLEEERKHDMRKTRFALWPALLGAFATLAAAAIGVFPKAIDIYQIGRKVDAIHHKEEGVFATFLTGMNVVGELGKPDQALNTAIPDCNAAKKETPVPIPPPIFPSIPAVARPTPDEIASKPETIGRCSGLGGLKLKSIRVDSINTGYVITMRVRNEGPTQVLYIGQPTLTDGKSSILGSTVPSYGPGYIQSTLDPKQLSDMYAQGTSFSSADDSTIHMEFRGNKPQPPASSISLSSSFTHLTKDDKGTVNREVTPMGCEAVPIASEQ